MGRKSKTGGGCQKTTDLSGRKVNAQGVFNGLLPSYGGGSMTAPYGQRHTCIKVGRQITRNSRCKTNGMKLRLTAFGQIRWRTSIFMRLCHKISATAKNK